MSLSVKRKVYQEVIQELQQYIEENNLNPGDKLPSERELSEKLEAGRSSVREALRALELIGLIETRHGEGTYLRAYRSFQTVELLSSFILRQENIRTDLSLTKRIIEKEAAKLAFHGIQETDIKNLEAITAREYTGAETMHGVFFNYLFDNTRNLLLKKIWILMEEFSNTVSTEEYDAAFCRQLIQLYSNRDYESIEGLFIQDMNVQDK